MTSSASMAAKNAFVDCMSMSAAVNFAGYGVAADQFRSLAGSLPTGVCVITTSDARGGPVGMTSGAVCSLSCEPPLLLTCLSRGSKTLAAIRERDAFVVNVLAAHSAELSNRFAGAVTDRFADVAWTREGGGGLPVLTDGAVAHAVCHVYQLVNAGDHVIVIGLIVAGEHRLDVEPLMYFRRAYSGFPIPGSA
jgi:flavin reductase (DIM6/NTAB) family NADH-FMN oxidoreductase RutF